MTYVKYLCLALAIAYWFCNVGKLIRKQDITSAQTYIMSFATAGFALLTHLGY